MISFSLAKIFRLISGELPDVMRSCSCRGLPSWLKALHIKLQHNANMHSVTVSPACTVKCHLNMNADCYGEGPYNAH